MNDSILNDPGTKIDMRPLMESGALRGGIVGFCWFLVVAVPAAWILWVQLGIGPFWGWVALGASCPCWTAFAAYAATWRTREETFTAEQRAVLRRHLRFARMLGACLTVISLLAVAGAFPDFLHWIPLSMLMILAIRAGSSLLGRIEGYAAVRVMQQEARQIVCRIDAKPLALASDGCSSSLVQPSLERIAEPRYQPDEAKRLAEMGLED